MSDDYQRMTEVIHFLDSNLVEQLSLDTVATRFGINPARILHITHHSTLVSSQSCLRQLTRNRARQLLNQSVPLPDSDPDNPPLFNDLIIATDIIPRDKHRRTRERQPLRYGIHPTPFGSALVAISTIGLCRLDFVDNNTLDKLEQLRKSWPNAELIEDKQLTAGMAERVFAPRSVTTDKPLLLHLRGTSFQIKVWQALLGIAPGCICDYRRIAEQIGRPTAARAVGHAIGQNPLCYIIPCHRVIRSDGSPGGYRGGILRKKVMLTIETLYS